MYPPKPVRLKLFIEKLRDHPPVTNREDALSLMVRLMAEAEDYYQLPPNDYSIRMGVFRPNQSYDNGWKDLDSDPCYWDDSVSKTHRTLVYNSGRIVIKKIKENPAIVVLDKPGS